MPLRNIVNTMREKERQAILDEDKRVANKIYDQTKLSKTRDDEVLTEREEMKSNIEYVIEKKFLELDSAIKEEITAIDSEENFQNFNKIVNIYNTIALFLNKIVKYPILNQNDKIGIDKRFDEINV